MLRINADDFGMSASINRAILRCFEQRLITSATLMANMQAFEDACRLTLASGLDGKIGVHLNLTEGRPLLAETERCRELCDENGRFRRHRPWLLSRTARKLAESELTAQIRQCREHGIQVTHADSHQHVHNEPALLAVFCRVVRTAGIPELRCARNSDRRSLLSLRRFYKGIANLYLSLQGLRATTYLGSVAGFVERHASGRWKGQSFEVLVHPEFDASGQLFDHVEKMPLEACLLQLRELQETRLATARAA
ncbi:MAG: ChbG/HpnK family deacetylase [Planctomycetaceae bacterium]|nr:ChbG/HpnK family deacetylase [Planctomycetaceae bacterium]